MSIRILVAEDHEIVREGLCALLRQEPGFEIVGVARSGEEAARMDRELAPDVVLMDVVMEGGSGIEATRAIVKARPGARIIALSAYEDKRFVREMIQAGAAGYSLKRQSSQEVAAAVRAVHSGHTFLSPALVLTLTKAEGGEEESTGREPELTAREKEVLGLIAGGLSSKEIAGRLGISVQTVSNHRTSLMRKTKLGSVAELVRLAIRLGMAGA